MTDDIRIANIEKSVAVIEAHSQFTTTTLSEMKTAQKEFCKSIEEELKDHQKQINSIRQEQVTIRTVVKVSSIIGVAIGTCLLTIGKYFMLFAGAILR